METILLLNKGEKVKLEGKTRRDLYIQVVKYLYNISSESKIIISENVAVYSEAKKFRNTKQTVNLGDNFHLYINYSILDINKRISKLLDIFGIEIIDEDMDEGDTIKNIEKQDSSEGCVYLLKNISMPGIYKIGITKRSDLNLRLKELYSTNIPTPFEVVYSVITEDAYAIEQAIHDIMSDCRVNSKREFFKLNEIELKMVIKMMKCLGVNN